MSSAAQQLFECEPRLLARFSLDREIVGDRLEPGVEREHLALQHDTAYRFRTACLERAALRERDVPVVPERDLDAGDTLLLREALHGPALDRHASGQRLLELVREHLDECLQVTARGAKGR